ncbi:MAG: DUF1838 domain-containing protein [Rhodospirillaceae bacterium]|nr:DUF1838 domain-containing protein [Rhodospirillaceae bacterium]
MQNTASDTVSSTRLSRRCGLQLGSAAIVATLAGGASALAALNPVADAPQVYRKLRYRAGQGVVFWWLEGTKFGQLGAEVKPIFDMKVGSWMRIDDKPDGGYDVTSLEIVFYTEFQTNTLLRQWANPYSQQTIEVKYAPVGPTTLRHTPAGEAITPKELGGAQLNASMKVGPAVIKGEDVWINHDATAAVTSPDGKSPVFRVNDWSMYHGKASDMAEGGPAFAPATCYLHEITSWARWMGMGEQPGNLTSRAVGRKVETYGEMPEVWRGFIADFYPDIVKDPIAALDRPTAKFDR